MNETHQKLIDIGSRILGASRNELYVSMRFLDLALSALRYEMNLSSLYVGTDGEKILFNPRYLIQRYLSDRVLVNRVYLHMVLHCLFRHPFHQGQREEAYWNLACDIAVESIVDALPYRAVQLVVSDRRAEWYEKLRRELPVLSAEGIYEILQKEALSIQEFGALQLEFWVDDHVFWQKRQEDDSKAKQDGEDSENQEDPRRQEEEHRQQMEETWQEISEKMQTDLETFSKDAGEEAGELLQSLRVENRERYDYRRFLQKFVTCKEEMQVDDDSYDYIFYTYGLQLYGNLPLIEALEYKEVKKVEELVIALDTSESCEGDTVRRFLEETYAILQQNESFFHSFRVHILQCDAQIQQDTVITSAQELERYMESFVLRGNGGTDFRPVFSYVAQLMEEKVFRQLKGLIYFTDGWGAFPKRRPPYDTAFVFLDDGMYNEREVPPWAMKVVLGRKDLEISYQKE